MTQATELRELASLLRVNGGNIGIGPLTADPPHTLSLGQTNVAGEQTIRLAGNGNPKHEIQFREAGVGYGFTFRYAGDALDNKLHIVQHENDTGGTEVMTFMRDSMEVGIGTDSPDLLYEGLHIKSANPSLKIEGTATNSWEFIHLKQPNHDRLIGMRTTGNIVINSGTNLDANNMLVIDTAGKVGINVEYPDHDLDVDGAIATRQVRHSVRPTLNLDFANSKELDPRITFYRDSIATYYDNKGILRYANYNEPRFDHDPVTGESKGLLIEDSNTNLLEDASRGTMGWSHDAVITRDNAAEAPDGTFDAFLLQPTTSDGKISSGNTTSGAGTYTGSVWLKSATTDGSNVSTAIALYDVNSFYTNNITVTSEWQRFNVTYTSTNASTSYPRFYVGGSSSLAKGEDLYVWGAQLETGDFATSYIPASEQFQSRGGTTGAGTYYDYEGKLTTATGSHERYGYKHNGRKWIPTGLIRESEATNLWNHSEDTYNYNWVKSGVSVSKRGTILGPDGQYSAQRITASAGGSYHYMYRNAVSVLTSGKWYTVSFFVKSGTQNRIATYHSDGSTTRQFIFNMDTKAFEYENVDYYGYEEAYDGWMRLWYTFQATANVSPNMHFFMKTTGQYTTSGGEYFDFFGFQLEEELNNNQNAGPTSYIKTEASSVTRGADVVSTASSNREIEVAKIDNINYSDWYNTKEGSIYTDFHPINSSDNVVIGVGDGTGRGFRAPWLSGATQIRTGTWSGTIYSALHYYNSIVPTDPHKSALSFSYADNTFLSSLDGSTTAVTSPWPGVETDATTIWIGGETDTNRPYNGHIRKVSIYNEALSTAELQALTENN